MNQTDETSKTFITAEELRVLHAALDGISMYLIRYHPKLLDDLQNDFDKVGAVIETLHRRIKP